MSKPSAGPQVREVKCIECDAVLVIMKHTVHREPKEPAPCPACGKPCQKKDNGKRPDSKTGKWYTVSYRDEITSAHLKQPSEVVNDGFYVPKNG